MTSYRERAYPHPVMSPFNDDYLGESTLTIAISPRLVDEGSAQRLEIACDVNLSNEWLRALLEVGGCRLVLDVDSRWTLRRRFVELGLPDSTIVFEEGELMGPVELTPILVAAADNALYSPEGINSEFGAGPFPVEEGDVLGIGQSVVLDLDFSRQLHRNLIKFQLLEDQPDNYEFDLSGNVIIIRVGENVNKAVHELRHAPFGKPLLFMSIYKDCFAAAVRTLAYAAAEEPEAANLDWARSLSVKLDSLGLPLPEETETAEIERIAQALVAERGVRKVDLSDV